MPPVDGLWKRSRNKKKISVQPHWFAALSSRTSETLVWLNAQNVANGNSDVTSASYQHSLSGAPSPHPRWRLTWSPELQTHWKIHFCGQHFSRISIITLQVEFYDYCNKHSWLLANKIQAYLLLYFHLLLFWLEDLKQMVKWINWQMINTQMLIYLFIFINMDIYSSR